MKTQAKGSSLAPFVALGVLAISTALWGLWNRGLTPTITPSSPSPSPLSTAPYYVRLHMGKHFSGEKNLVFEVPFLSDGKQRRTYERTKGLKWLIDIRARRSSNTNVDVQVQAKLVDTIHGDLPRQALLRGGFQGALDTPSIPIADQKTGKAPPAERVWKVLVTSQPSQEAIVDSRYLR